MTEKSQRNLHLIGTGHLFRKEKKHWIVLASKSARRIQLMNMIGIGPLYICPSLFEENLNKADFPNAEEYVSETALRKGKDVAERIWGIWGNNCEKEKEKQKEKKQEHGHGQEQEQSSHKINTVEIEHMEANTVDALSYCSELVNTEISLSNNVTETIKVNPLPKVIISCDTIVTLKGEIIEKPKNKEDAFEMLKKLSAQMHTVYTAVCIFLLTKKEPVVFVEKTNVYFDELSDTDIEQYLILNEAYDKAGAYGIQGFGSEFIKKIEGCFYNVMGLPIWKLSKTLAHLYEEGYFTF